MIKNMSDEKHTASIDWSIIHRNLADARAVIEQEWMPSASEKKRILKERAIALAQEPEDKKTSEDYLEVVEFLLAYEKYGIESGYVSEVYPMKELTPLPCTPPFIPGIINVRGQIISVIDIKKFFDLTDKGLTDLNKVIIVTDGKMELGILADVILGVRSVALSELQPSLPTLTGVRAEYLKGVTEERFIILDVEKILSDEKIIVHDEV